MTSVVGGSDQYRGGAGGPQRVHADAVVDRYGRGGRVSVPQVLAGAERAGVRDRGDAVRTQYGVRQGERLRGAGDDQYPVRVDADAAAARQPAGDGVAQLWGATGVTVSEIPGGQLGEHGPFGAA